MLYMRLKIVGPWIFFLFVLTSFTFACSSQVERIPELDTSNNDTRFILVLPKEHWQTLFPDMQGEVNIFSIGSDGTDLRPLFFGVRGYNYVEGISFSQNELLLSSFSEAQVLGKQSLGNLYVWNIKDAAPMLISNSYVAGGYPFTPKALWLSNNEVIYVGEQGNEIALFKTYLNENITDRVFGLDSSIHPLLRLLSASTNGFIYWQNGTITPETSVIETDFWRVGPNGEDLARVGTKDGTKLPFFSVSPNGNLIVHGKSILDKNFNTIVELPLINEPTDAYWSESSEQVFLSMRICHTPACVEYEMSYYIWQHSFVSSFAQIDIDITVNWALWSPNEKQILLYHYSGITNQWKLLPFVFDLDSGELEAILPNLKDIANYYVFWAP